MIYVRIAVLLVAVISASAGARADTADPWALLSQPGHFAMIRHALAPGSGDPPGFSLDDCTTQRNLNDVGRAQAKRIGDLFRAAGIDQAAVFTSQWCRCRETAAGLKLGTPEDLPYLNSFYERPDRMDRQMDALRAWLAAYPFDRATVLVTHYTVISSLAGTAPRSGEIVFVRREDNGLFKVVATVATD